MNEGFTTFLERIIAAKVFNEKERNLQASRKVFVKQHNSRVVTLLYILSSWMEPDGR